MADSITHAHLKVGPQGRIVIPAKLRKALGIEPGQKLVARIDEDHLVLERQSAALDRLRKQFAQIPADISLSDELIAERRAEARRELLD